MGKLLRPSGRENGMNPLVLLTGRPCAFDTEKHPMKAFELKCCQYNYYGVDLPPRLFFDGKRRSVVDNAFREVLERVGNLCKA
jgi:hypothetical protein